MRFHVNKKVRFWPGYFCWLGVRLIPLFFRTCFPLCSENTHRPQNGLTAHTALTGGRCSPNQTLTASFQHSARTDQNNTAAKTPWKQNVQQCLRSIKPNTVTGSHRKPCGVLFMFRFLLGPGGLWNVRIQTWCFPGLTSADEFFSVLIIDPDFV